MAEETLTTRDNRTGASFGLKFTTNSGIILVANTLIPLARGGMQPNVIWTGGLEYAF